MVKYVNINSNIYITSMTYSISIKIRWLKEIMKCSAITKVCENQLAKEKKY